jgi:hypothetical protein
MWTTDTLKDAVCNWEILSEAQSAEFLGFMNSRFPARAFRKQLNKRRIALANMVKARKLLDGAVQGYPDAMNYKSLDDSFGSMQGCAIVFTAGGEGERLRLSLIDKGIPAESLHDFTKATYPLKGFYQNFGTLQINMAMVGWICRKCGIDIPVIVTTGSETSVTYRVIPKILEENKYFGLSHVKTVPQDERLHFTIDEQIAIRLTDGKPYPVTQPDETGGPLMKLKERTDKDGLTPLEWLAGLGCEKLLIVQGTAIYEPRMLSYMAVVAQGHDCVGVGIPRADFPPADPFGTFVSIEKGGKRSVCIVEQNIRNDDTRSIRNDNTGEYLPFNTGFYAVDRDLLEDNDLPDYATPPKEVLPGLMRSPKIGYAATDILPLAKRPLILTVSQDMYAVIKTAEDLETMTETAVRFGLREMVAAGD